MSRGSHKDPPKFKRRKHRLYLLTGGGGEGGEGSGRTFGARTNIVAIFEKYPLPQLPFKSKLWFICFHHCLKILHFTSPFFCLWTFGLFSVFCSCEHLCCRQSCISLLIHVCKLPLLGIYVGAGLLCHRVPDIQPCSIILNCLLQELNPFRISHQQYISSSFFPSSLLYTFPFMCVCIIRVYCLLYKVNFKNSEFLFALLTTTFPVPRRMPGKNNLLNEVLCPVTSNWTWFIWRFVWKFEVQLFSFKIKDISFQE